MKMTDENKKLNDLIRKQAPDAIEAMGDMLRDPNTPAPTRAQLIGYILERTLGKADTTIHLMTETGNIKDSENRLIAIAQEIREAMEDDPDAPAESETTEEEQEDAYETDYTGDDCEDDGEVEEDEYPEG